ncbi:CHAT domain-containing protein [Rhodoferax aquaticus]|uniref:CHAT domain-containing protein n=1 Tax=Rhodoferax aquaticus TaxID=2527691 RepID=UPI00143D2AA3|nr:CHAT domain-containing protein [Rhodoferax aquaticus]
MRFIATLAMLCGCALPVLAQSDDIAGAFKALTSEETANLRYRLAQPLPVTKNADTLSMYIDVKINAAKRLADSAAYEVVMREAVRALPNNATYKHNLALALYSRGDANQEGNDLMRQAIVLFSPVHGAFSAALLGCELLLQSNLEGASKTLMDSRELLRVLELAPAKGKDQRLLTRAQGKMQECTSRLESYKGQPQKAIEAAEQAAHLARQELKLVQAANDPGRLKELYAFQSVINALERKLGAYREAGRLGDAETALKELVEFSSRHQLPPDFLSRIYRTAANLRFSQREFALAEQLYRKADAVRAKLGVPEASVERAQISRDLMNSLSAQGRWKDAFALRTGLDQLEQANPKLQGKTGLNTDNGYLYFGNQQYAKAAVFFARSVKFNQANLGEQHFFTTQAQGLQGAALWRAGGSDNQVAALPLLKSAVRAYMLPANADNLENVGLRKEYREIVFAAYLDALALTPGEDATQAMGAADWVRGGVVQDALNDAAVRAAARTPALVQLVRREQDIKLEISGLRTLLSQDAGQALSETRDKIAALEKDRQQLQADIKTAMPEYDRLVHPVPPTVQEIASKLDSKQAVLLLLPTPQAVYVWAVSADRPAAFVRADMGADTVKALVNRLRQQLDFGTPGNAGTRFDGDAAFQLYDTLLAPVAPAWRGKTQLIVAAGGALSQIPLGLLHTRAGGGFDSKAPWLIRDAAIAQVPSLSAWLALKTVSQTKNADPSFVAWGDPAFRMQASAATGQTTLRSQSTASNSANDLALDLDALAKPNASGLRYADIPALPETRDELLAIAKTLKANPGSDVYLGARATRESVLAASQSGQLQNKRVIAFATHGLMAGDLPKLTQPALALAATGAEAQNPLAPLLTLEDVLSLKLNADWVVLSACNTAAADGKAEEALSGLARGFFYAGSRSLLVTHWAVESESAKLLTTSTFAHYAANPKEPKAESLRQAMLKVMANPKYAHPAFWAPYALVGDGGR